MAILWQVVSVSLSLPVRLSALVGPPQGLSARLFLFDDECSS